MIFCETRLPIWFLNRIKLSLFLWFVVPISTKRVLTRLQIPEVLVHRAYFLSLYKRIPETLPPSLSYYFDNAHSTYGHCFLWSLGALKMAIYCWWIFGSHLIGVLNSQLICLMHSRLVKSRLKWTWDFNILILLCINPTIFIPATRRYWIVILYLFITFYRKNSLYIWMGTLVTSGVQGKRWPQTLSEYFLRVT